MVLTEGLFLPAVKQTWYRDKRMENCQRGRKGELCGASVREGWDKCQKNKNKIPAEALRPSCTGSCGLKIIRRVFYCKDSIIFWLALIFKQHRKTWFNCCLVWTCQSTSKRHGFQTVVQLFVSYVCIHFLFWKAHYVVSEKKFKLRISIFTILIR